MNKIKQIWNFRVMFFSSAFACLGVLMTLWEISGFFCKLDELEYWNIISNTVGILIITYGGMRIVTFSSSINAT